MTRKLSLSVVAVALTVACTRATPEQQIVNDAAAAMGGAERVSAVKTLVLEGTGTQYNLGQDLVPGASGQTFTVSAFKRTVDVPGGRARTELTRTPNFTFFQGPAAQKQVAGIDGAVAYNVAPNGTGTRAPEPVAADRRAELLHHPVTAVRAALDPMAKLSNPRTEGGQSMVDVATAGGQQFTLAIDATTKLPSKVTTRAYNVNLGDVVIGTAFADYQAVGGLQLPAKLTTATDDFTTQDVTLSKQEVDAARDRHGRAGCRGAGAHRAAAGADGRGGAARRRHLVAGRGLAPQRAGGVCRSSDADRGAAQRGAHAGRDCEGPPAGARQAADPGRDQPPPLRPFGRCACSDLRGADGDHAPGQRRVLPGDGQAGAHHPAGCACRSRARPRPCRASTGSCRCRTRR